MRIAITGGTGFVGRHLAERLECEGHEMVVLSRRTGAGLHLDPSELARRDERRSWGLGVFVLIMAGWVAGLGLTETRCWVATEGVDGRVVYADVPNAEDVILDETQVGAGCGGGEPTLAGVGLGLAFAASAVALAAWGSRPGRDGTDPVTA